MDVREKILDTTFRFLMDEGCRKVTMDEIAAFNGMSKRTIYENFSDKEDLIEQCIKYACGKMEHAVQSRLDQGSEFLDIVFDFPPRDSRSAMLRVMKFMDDVERYHPQVFARVKAYVSSIHADNMQSLLRKGIDEGLLLPSLPVEELAFILVRILDLFVDKKTMECRTIAQDDLFILLFVTYIRGLATEAGRKRIDVRIKMINQRKQTI